MNNFRGRNSILINEIANSFKDKRGALFLGAGTSKGVGLPSWENLIEEFAKDLDIDIQTTKLSYYQIAQYYQNKHSKPKLLEKTVELLNVFTHDNDYNTIDKLTSLDCTSIWTSNFDSILEDYLRFKKRKKVNVITTEFDIISNDISKNINIFKVNGSVGGYSNAIVSKEDFENHIATHHQLITLFKRELTIKNFLFIGYSFTDELVLPCIKDLMRSFKGETHYHYAILKRIPNEKVKETTINDDREKKHNAIKNENYSEFEHFINDLEIRYRIKTIIIDDYSEIPKILDAIYHIQRRRTVFISGSQATQNLNLINSTRLFTEILINKLLDNNYKVICGDGHVIGNVMSSIATKKALEHSTLMHDKYLEMYPFSSGYSDDEKNVHRKYMINQSRFFISMFGCDERSHGMYDEYKIAQNLIKEETNDTKYNDYKYFDIPLKLIPLKYTGGMAEKIFNEFSKTEECLFTNDDLDILNIKTNLFIESNIDDFMNINLKDKSRETFEKQLKKEFTEYIDKILIIMEKYV